MPAWTLSALILIPLGGGVVAWLAGRQRPAAARWVALAAALLTFALALWLWAALGRDAAAASGPVLEQRAAWIPRFGVECHLALDGLNLMFVVLTGLLGCVATLASWREVERSEGLHYLCVLASVAGIMGVFVAFDLFLFYFFWELMLVPMYFLIGVWGHEARVRAAIKFVIFTMVSGLFLLVSIIGLYWAHAQASGSATTDYTALLGTSVAPNLGVWLFLGFFVAFAVKLPMFPLHSWLPDAHTQAPTAGSILLAGLLLKTGGYGMIRFAVPLFPSAAARLAGPIAVVGVVGILYGAVLAFGQTDMKRLIAYTSVSHMGFVVLGVATWRLVAVQGAVFQMLAHGVATGALFALAGMVQERFHSREFADLGGLWGRLPRLSAFALLFALASVGVPGAGNFIGELLTLLGAWPVARALVAVAVAGIVLGTIAMLALVQGTLHGRAAGSQPVGDAGLREVVMLAALAVAVLALGVFPQPALRVAAPTIEQIVAREASFNPADPREPGRRDRVTAVPAGGEEAS